ncbi:MAG TPA: ROK family protein [Candidatus Scatovivens faecipullorum]|mgnify:FL=1|jgi:N-acetylmannosamine kinase|nr:ROK family protein [Candidatus Scatovivens faecipullorum]
MKIGIDLGGSHIGIGLVEQNNLKAVVDKFFTQEDRKNIETAILNNIDELINKILEENELSIKDIEKIGVASPGTVTNGHIISWNLGLKNFDLQTKLIEKYNLPVKIRNDGKCAALAEKKYGAMKNYDDCVFINIGTGIGGAAFIDGKLLEPKRFSGFEFGHITLVKDGLECTCGKKGCFERYASIKALKTRITNTLGIDGTDISGQYLREELMVKYHDEVQDDINEFIDYLRIGVCNLIDIFEPEIVCFGGSFSYYEGHPVLNKLIEEINKPESTFNKSSVKIVTAEMKNDAGIIGATIDF